METFWLIYANAEGEISEHTLTNVNTSKNDRITGYSQERGGIRTFKINQILKAVNKQTGEILIDNLPEEDLQPNP